MNQQAYKTVQAYGFDEFIINKSRFIGHAKPVASQEEALAFLQELRQRYNDASHT